MAELNTSHPNYANILVAEFFTEDDVQFSTSRIGP